MSRHENSTPRRKFVKAPKKSVSMTGNYGIARFAGQRRG